MTADVADTISKSVGIKANLPDRKIRNVGLKGNNVNITGNTRFQSTETQIERAVFNLLRMKGYDRITVKDICAEAGINRSSFYAHYQDINDLMIKIENNLAQTLQKTMTPINDLAAGGMNINPFVAFFNCVYEYRIFYRAFLKSNTPSFIAPHMAKDNKLLLQQLSRQKNLNYTDAEIEYHMQFFGGGLKAVCEKWLTSGCKETPEQVAQIIQNEYTNNAKYFIKI